MSRIQTLAVAGLAAFGLFVVTGCGSDAAPAETGASMTGTVTYGGESVAFGMVRVKGEGGASAGMIGAGGKYVVHNCPTGPVTIGVDTAAARSDFESARTGGGMTMSGGKGGGKGKPKFVDVPGKFAQPDTSGLTHTLAAGENTHDIVIKK